MGLSSRQPVHARNRHGQDRRHDPRKAADQWHDRIGGAYRRLIAVFLAFVWLAQPAAAQSLRIAFWNADLSRKGPGLLLKAIQGGEDAQIAAALQVIDRLDADILVLSGVDYDLRLAALNAFADHLANPYPERFAFPPNTGVPTGLDLDHNGRLGEPRDAQGYGRFAGQGGLAILSRLPIDRTAARDFAAFLWRDLPGALMPTDMTPEAIALQRLSYTGHWDIPVLLPSGQPLHLLVWHGSPPVFDGPEDRNGKRNHDEAAFWLRYLAGDLPDPPPVAPFLLIGQSNLDPVKGDGLTDAITALITHPALQDPAPQGAAGAATAAYGGNIGNLRTDLILPSVDLRLTAKAVDWPLPGDPWLATLDAASRHRPVWVDIAWP